MSNPLSISLSTATSACPVRSFNEWDPLEEVIVGSLDYATKPYHGDTHDFPARPPALPLVQPPGAKLRGHSVLGPVITGGIYGSRLDFS